ncbi:MAG: T9SS type A sorting domain-containing protein [Bacteroidetes bacterium]|nr:T9SS type A sorting domain-containing protein [Bacteroidota bacterium]
MKKLILFSLFIFPTFVSAQIVNIPDAIFKAYLVGNISINTNSDSEIQVLEASVFIGSIDVFGLGISDLTGIEAFTSLTNLSCAYNSLTSLDVSSNTALTELYCYNNLLTSLNVKNGNNTLLLFCEPLLPYSCTPSFYAHNNPNLYCISVDDTAYSNANWFIGKDSWAVFSDNCLVGIEDNELNQPSITTANNTITIEGTEGTVAVYNLLGQVVAKANLPATIRVESGVYLVRVKSEGGVSSKKVVVSSN